LENIKREKEKCKAQGFYIEEEFEFLCVVPLSDGEIS
jgi:hypothetical protein